MSRPKGTGSVRRIGPDRWLVRWWENGRRRSKVVRGEREDAERVLDNYLALLEVEGALCGATTLRVYGERYLDTIEVQGFESIAAARSRWRCHLATSAFIDWPLDAITSAEVSLWSDELLRGGLRPRTVRQCVFLLSAILRHAGERGLIEDNPVRRVRKPKVRETRRERILSLEELDAVATSSGLTEPIRWTILALAGTGLRPGELLGLELADVCLEGYEPHLRVRRSGRRARSTKTDQFRRVELCGLGLEAVVHWVEVVRPKLSIKRTDVKRSRWAFPIPVGWLRGDNQFGDAMRVLGIEDLHAHDLRGTWASHALSGSWGHAWTIAEVAAHIGDSIATTQRHYAHLVASATRRAADRTKARPVGKPPGNAPIQPRGITRSRQGLRIQGSGVRISPGVPAESFGNLVTHAGGRFPNVSHLARSYLEACASGDDRAHELALALSAATRALLEPATATLDLCAEIDDGGPYWDRRANALATLLLELEAIESKEDVG